ncbi:MAG TPA: hypothetical protein VKE93_11705 [Candidatus Angelobacter sp.]|nr:hypothetical protein [Candidatus Angelobacter sp.]
MRRILPPLLLLLLLSSGLAAQEVDAGALLRRSSKNEVAALEHPDPFRFKERTEQSSGSETRDVIETSQGRADRIIAFQDKPLAGDQNEKQNRRLQKLLTSSDALRDEMKDQQEETRRRLRMAAALPNAILLQFAGTEQDGQLRFTFTPNPAFSPHDRESQIYRGMRGTVWIDPVHERLTHVKGELFKDVTFGWGILGKLNKGGHYEAEQTQVAPGVWKMTLLDVDFRGSVFFFGRIRIQRKETSADFAPSPPDLTIQAAIKQLMAKYPLKATSSQ